MRMLFFFRALLHSMNNSCILRGFRKIESNDQKHATPRTTTCKPYKYFFRDRIEPATRSAAVIRSATVPTVPSPELLTITHDSNDGFA